MRKTEWVQPYRGPFSETEARMLAGDLKIVANEKVNGIHDAKAIMRPLPRTGVRPDEWHKWDVFIEVEIECETCGNTGEISAMETVDPREPHLTADVGSAPCPDCTINDEE